MSEEVIEVKIFMNDGQRKFGVLLNASETLDCRVDTIKFVCNSQLNNYFSTAAQHLIELLPLQEVKTVDTFLR